MKITLFFFFILITGYWGIGQSLSPEVIASSGAHFSNTNYQLSWTIGQPVSETFVGQDMNQLTQGFHQTFLIVTPINDLMSDTQVKVYPNPSSAWLNIEFQETYESFSLELSDATGSLLQSIPPNQQSRIITLDLTLLNPGLYLLQLKNIDLNTKQTFKILKIK